MFLALALCFVSGCSEHSVPNQPFYGLNSGYFFTTWYSSAPCSDAPCFNMIEVFYYSRVELPPTMTVQGEINATFPISMEAFWEVTEVAGGAIALGTGYSRGGCVEGLPVESLNTFSGDWGRGVEIQGCNSEEIEKARQVMRAVALTYLPI